MLSFACRRRYPAFSGKTKDSVRFEVFRRDTQNTRSSGRSHGRGLSRFRTATCWRRAMFSSCNVARLRTITRRKSTRIMMIVCMPQTVAGSKLKCHDFCRRRGFEERHRASNWEQQSISARAAFSQTAGPRLKRLANRLGPDGGALRRDSSTWT